MTMMAPYYTSPPPYNDRASLAGSLEDFSSGDGEHPSPLFGVPSQHSGFRALSESDGEDEVEDDGGDEGEEEEEESVSDNSPWSPPMSAWRQPTSPGGWYRHQPYGQGRKRAKSSASPTARTKQEGSRHTSPLYKSALEDEDATLAANIPLPKGSVSPLKGSPARDSVDRRSVERHTPAQARSRTSTPMPALADEGDTSREKGLLQSPLSPNNYIRFALRADIQQRTEPIDAALSWLHTYMNRASKSWTSLSSSIMILVLALTTLRLLIQAPAMPPSPDLVKVAGLARSFEPLIFYSEHTVRQIGDLQETGVAVWDLGESVRSANMTSAPIIVEKLDALSDSLKGLAIELTKFFANVDGDIDGILIVMDWAKRELSALDTTPGSSMSHAFTNIYTLLSTVGVLESRRTGLQTPLGKLFTTVFGATRSQRTHQALHRTFHEFLGVLEESINAELTYSTALFALFESIDQQFLNLHRTVVRESDTQERLESEFLSSLWTRIAGANQGTLRKYEKNKDLLASVRAKTTQNKSLLVEHNGKLMGMKENLEVLRRKLMGPLVSRTDGARLAVTEQIQGLEGTYDYLKGVREKQKNRMLEILYGAGGRRAVISQE